MMRNKTKKTEFKSNYNLDGIKFKLDERLLKFSISEDTKNKVCAKIYLINNRLLTTEQYSSSPFKLFIKSYCYTRPIRDSSLYYKLMDDGSECIIIVYDDFDKMVKSYNFKELAERMIVYSDYNTIELRTNDGYFLKSINGLLSLNYIHDNLMELDSHVKLDVKRGGL